MFLFLKAFSNTADYNFEPFIIKSVRFMHVKNCNQLKASWILQIINHFFKK